MKALDDSASSQSQVEPLLAALGSPSLTEHKDGSVRLYVALAVAEVIRIFVPNTPFDDNKTKVLRLLLPSFGSH